MSSTCFSAASILRCDLLSTNESIGLVIPVILQAILTSSLTVLLWARSRHHLFLASEGWIDLLLSVLNLFWELYPAVRRSLHIFKSLDIIIGSMSFIPILFYSLFLCSLILSDFITILPPSVRRVVRPFLIFFVPVLIGIHEAASFIGISYAFSSTNQSMITFQINRDKDLWTFFTSSTLALFACFQAIAACLAIVRVVQFLMQRRRLEHRYGDYPRKIHGLGWVNAGIQFGVIETIIGFAAIACFGTHLTRRIIRLVSRALLCIGLFIGDDRNDSSTEKSVVTPYRQSRLKPFISNPRFSTFERLSPTTTGFHHKPQAPPMIVATRDSDFVSLKDEFNGAPGQQRVKILFDQGAPQLEVRLSYIELLYPQPAVTTPSESPTRSYSPLPDYVPRPFARPYGSNTDSMVSSLSKAEIVTVPRTLFVPELAKATVMRTPSGRTVNRPVSSRPTSRPPSQHSVSSSHELLSLESRETKGKRVMSGEQNEEFYDMLTSAGVRSLAGHQAEEVREDMNISTVPSGGSLPSLALSFNADTAIQGDHRPSSTEEYYPVTVRFSQEQLDIQQEIFENSSLPVSFAYGSGFHQPPGQLVRGRMDDNNRASTLPPRPPRNPSRTSNFRQGSPDSSLLTPIAVIGEFASPFRQREESPSSRKETERRQPSVHFKTPPLPLHTPKPSLTTEPASPARTDSDSAYSSETYERQSWASQVSFDPDQVAIAL